ncbi:putative JmjC domain-containing histone demethylation protein 2C [Nymphon striatum]|nr:putative JmjC domain-containing histone demethylation protein 2C [Nymphon striatum]
MLLIREGGERINNRTVDGWMMFHSRHVSDIPRRSVVGEVQARSRPARLIKQLLSLLAVPLILSSHDFVFAFFQNSDLEKQQLRQEYSEVGNAVKKWTEYQDGQRILLTTPSVLVGYRIEVYRAEGTTQWYTAVIISYNDSTKELTVTDDTVLEDHNEDPCLVQMKLIGDGGE